MQPSSLKMCSPAATTGLQTQTVITTRVTIAIIWLAIVQPATNTHSYICIGNRMDLRAIKE